MRKNNSLTSNSFPWDDAEEMMEVLELNLHEGRMRQGQEFD